MGKRIEKMEDKKQKKIEKELATADEEDKERVKRKKTANLAK